MPDRQLPKTPNQTLADARRRYRMAKSELDEVGLRFAGRIAAAGARVERLMKPLRPSRYQQIRMVLARNDFAAMVRIKDYHRGHVQQSLPDVRKAEARLEALLTARSEAHVRARVRVAEAAAQLLALLPKDLDASAFAELEAHVRWWRRLNRKAQNAAGEAFGSEASVSRR